MIIKEAGRYELDQARVEAYQVSDVEYQQEIYQGQVLQEIKNRSKSPEQMILAILQLPNNHTFFTEKGVNGQIHKRITSVALQVSDNPDLLEEIYADFYHPLLMPIWYELSMISIDRFHKAEPEKYAAQILAAEIAMELEILFGDELGKVFGDRLKLAYRQCCHEQVSEIPTKVVKLLKKLKSFANNPLFTDEVWEKITELQRLILIVEPPEIESLN